MRSILPNKITIEPEDPYIALLSFLETYNRDLQSEDINNLISEMVQVNLAQKTYRLWLETFKEVLIESGALKETD
jgi:hypothetical protein